jgi:hypothetical protein
MSHHNRLLSITDNADDNHISTDEQSVRIHREGEERWPAVVPAFMSLSDFVGQNDVISEWNDLTEQASHYHNDFQGMGRHLMRESSLRTMADHTEFGPRLTVNRMAEHEESVKKEASPVSCLLDVWSMKQRLHDDHATLDIETKKRHQTDIQSLDFATLRTRSDSMDSTACIADDFEEATMAARGA